MPPAAAVNPVIASTSPAANCPGTTRHVKVSAKTSAMSRARLLTRPLRAVQLFNHASLGCNEIYLLGKPRVIGNH